MIGGLSGAVLVAVAGDPVELSWQVVQAGALVGVAGADDGASVGADLMTGAVGQVEVGDVVGLGRPFGTQAAARALPQP